MFKNTFSETFRTGTALEQVPEMELKNSKSSLRTETGSLEILDSNH